MHTIINNDNQIIEFKHMSGHDMIGEVKQLFLEYAQSLEIDLSFQDFETEVNSLPGKYTAPGGALILALAGDKAVGSIALRKFSEDICELKRLFVRDNFKGLGIGRDLITKVIEEAAKQGYKYIRLDTLPTMKKA